jgi:hypothetical protein
MSNDIGTMFSQAYSKKVSLLSQQGSNVKVKITKKKNGKKKS